MLDLKITKVDGEEINLINEKEFDKIEFHRIANYYIKNATKCSAEADKIINHSYRVSQLGLKLMEGYQYPLSPRVIVVMGQIHDMFKLDRAGNKKLKISHAFRAGEFLEDLITTYPYAIGNKTSWIQCADAIKYHSNKDKLTMNVYANILKDADVLDKVSIWYFRDSRNVARANCNYSCYIKPYMKALITDKIEKLENYRGQSPKFEKIKAKKLKLAKLYGKIRYGL